MKRIFYLLIFCFSICFAQAQGVHIYKSNGDYEVIRDFDLDSIVFFHSASDKITITMLKAEANYSYVNCEAIAANDEAIPIIRCGFCFSTHNHPSLSDSVLVCKDNTPNMKLRGRMRPYQLYYVCAFVERPYGIAYSQPMSVTTGADPFMDGYEFVDLGLPSGLKWATCNVGAITPEGYGDYFAWGETTPKTNYSWSTYKYCQGSSSTMTKYCYYSGFGTVDNKTTLELADDAAHVNWGGAWRMPTKAEQDELRNNCTWTWTTQNNVNGYGVVGPNGNSIFLPAAGYRYNGSLNLVDSDGYYWSSSLSASASYYAYRLCIYSSNIGWNYINRYFGQSVRAVCK